MTDPTGNGSGPSGGDRHGGAGVEVHFEETVALSETGYSRLADVGGAVVAASVVGTLLFVAVSLALFFGAVAAASGRPIGDVVAAVASGVPPSVLPFVAGFVLLFVGGSLFAVLRVVRGGTATDEVHTRVTDGAVEVDRLGGYFGASSGVTVPLEAVTTVEYNDPGGAPKLNLGDVRAEKFVGGRGGDWVRIGRGDGPAVYLGSDRPRTLAEVVADVAPNVDRAEPFS